MADRRPGLRRQQPDQVRRQRDPEDRRTDHGIGRVRNVPPVLQELERLLFPRIGARERRLKYRTRLNYHQGVVKNVYCSELVILSYQLGLGDENHALFIKKDSKHTLPKTLRDHLRQAPRSRPRSVTTRRADGPYFRTVFRGGAFGRGPSRSSTSFFGATAL